MPGDMDIRSAYMDTDYAQILFYSSGPVGSHYEKYLHRSIRIGDLKEMMLKMETISSALERLKKEVPEILI
jgi:hypothetical protein